MSNIKKEAEKTMKFIIKKGVIYKLERITEDGIMMYKAINGSPSSNRENTQFYEDVCDTYNIQFIKNNENPVQYFFRKINESTNTVWEKTIESPALIGYLKVHKSDEECTKAIKKLKDIIKTHPYIEVKKAAYRTCEEVGVDNIEELSIYINEYNPNAYMYDFNEELPGSPTKHFIVNVKNSSYNTLHLVKNQKFIKYLEFYKDKCPKTIDLLIELVKTNHKQKIRSSAYVNEISLSQKVNFIMEHAGMVVSGDIGYASVLKKPLFDYCLVKYFTDIELFKSPEDFSLNMIDKFLADNKKNVLDIVTKAMGEETYNEMLTACEEAVEFRKAHFSDFRDEVADLLQAIRELVIKPDALSELMSALTNSVNSLADKGNIDMELVNKLANIIPVMEKVNTPEIAKAIIELHKNDNTAENVSDTTDDKERNNAKNDGKNNLKIVK